jgi:hypothetical protein
MSVLVIAKTILLGGALASAQDTTRYTPQDVARELPSLITVDSSRYGYSVDLDTVGARGGLGALARANRHYVLYLTRHTPSAALEKVAYTGNRASVRQQVLQRLVADTAYLRLIAESVTRQRGQRGGTASPGTTDESVRAVPFTRVQDVAARFFYPDAVLPNGRIQSRVCVDINGMLDMQGGRDLAVEAFAYAAIFHDILVPKFYVDADFDEANRLVNAMDLSTDPGTRLRRAQGAMKLRQVLVAEYERARTYLPFRVAEAPVGRGGAARR